ncbi:MAG: aminoacyl-tRNA hydrolase [Flavobacteriales bacterium]|nr:aminoacyl-tRNA hydrolase [Flavobacteriales bacterium]
MKYLIVGLGNIGDKYANTRHNIGFLFLDSLAEKYSMTFQNERFGQYANYKFRGRNLHFLKPDTYMNLSGNALQFWMKKLNIEKHQILIITDDLNLPFGTLRMRGKGSDGGHNGLKHIQFTLGTDQYPRIRVGISANFDAGKQIDYVLGEWTAEEKEQLPLLFDKMQKGLEEMVFRGIGMAMNSVNSKLLDA